MAKKTYALAVGKCLPESADSPMNQEILLGGHLYLMVLKVIAKYNNIILILVVCRRNWMNIW